MTFVVFEGSRWVYLSAADWTCPHLWVILRRMSKNETSWGRLARYVVQRREELGLPQTGLAALPGAPSLSTISKIEAAAQPAYRPRVIRGLERALGWAPGAVDAILSGGEPVIPGEARWTGDEPAAGSLVEQAIAADPTLVDEAKQHLLNQVRLLRRVVPSGYHVGYVWREGEPISIADLPPDERRKIDAAALRALRGKSEAQ